MKLIINLLIYFFISINCTSFANDEFIALSELQSFDTKIDKINKLENNSNIFKVYDSNILKGYTFITSSFADALGFSSAEFKILIYLSDTGKIINAKLLSHSEPLFLYDKGEVRYEGKGIDESILYKFILKYNNKNISKLTINAKNNPHNIDGVSSATITSILMHQSIIVSTNKVLEILGISNNKIVTLDHNNYAPLTWNEMLFDGSISNKKTSYIDINKNNLNSENKIFLDVYFAYANPVGIGQNIFGKTEYLKKFLRSGQDINDKGFFIATNGDFSLLVPRKCLNYKTSINIKNCEKRGIAKTYFDRFYLIQGNNKFNFRTRDRKNFMFTRNIEDSSPRFFNEISLLFIDNPDKFDPAKKSTLVVNYNSPEEEKYDLNYIPYSPPSRLIVKPNNTNLINTSGLSWLDVWLPQKFNIIILVLFILICSSILYFKDTLVKRRKTFSFIRFICLLFCLIWVGFISGAQLTIVNIFNYLQLLFVSNFNYSVIVFDPLILVISIVTLFSFFILGRGFFCGWLCPFGALQEIVSICAKGIGLIQLKVKDVFHRKLIYIKYIILFIMTSFLFIDLDIALLMTEVEPFKTSITLKFIRDYPYVMYAVVLLIISAFISRFYCRYICPLGAALTLGGKFRLFTILSRRKECGSPCHLCERSCPTQAIKNSGEIDMNECFYCLDCQEEYYDIHRCPPLVAEQKKIYR